MDGAWRAFATCVLLAGCGWDAAAPEPAAGPAPGVIAGSSATSTTVSPVTEHQPVEHSPAERPLVDAADVSIVGDLNDREQEIVDWALGRFALADLRLPTVIAIAFADDDACDGHPARCHPGGSPPRITICARDGSETQQLIDRRIAALHELAHVWHYAQRVDDEWPDFTDIVGGSRDGPDTCWEDRMEERVAVAISWGLMDQLRRPVRSELPCATLAEQFVALTGHLPLEPIEQVCIPASD